MKKIGNVIVSSPNYKVEDCYNKFLSLSNVDNDLPTMIIGLENAKKYIEGFSIFKKEYWNNMLWWTFSKTEKRSDYDKDIQKFYEICINNIINNIKYYNININELTYGKIKKVIEYIINNNKKIYYIDNNKTRLDEFKLQQYNFTNYKIDEYLGISHLTQHLLDISVDKNVYIIQLVSDYFKNPIPNEHSVNLIFGLKSYEVDPLKSDIGNIDTISKTFLIPKLHIWDCLLNSIHSMAHLQQIIFAGQHIRQYLKNNAINNTLQNVDYIIYNLFDNQFKSQIIYGDVSIFDDFANYINSDIHESLIVYKHNSEIQGFDIWVKFFK